MAKDKVYIPRLVFWETTKKCNLNCQHCRAVPESELAKGELTTEEAFAFFDSIKEFSNPIIVLSGGEPLYRKDIFEIAEYGIKKGLRMSLATNGTLIDQAMAKRIADTGFARVSISFDGANAKTHDSFRAIQGSFDKATRGIKLLAENGVSTQINTTIAKHNFKELPDILKMAIELKVDALHTFLLVPVGCGVDIAEDQMVSSEEYEKILNWFYDESKKCDIDLKATCAPHYFRVRTERILEEKRSGIKPPPFIPHGTQLKAGHVDKVTTPKDGLSAGAHGLSAMTKGCLAATGICFVSNKGEVFPCGYLPVMAGDIRKTPFKEIWDNAPVFENLRKPALLKGKCGRCEYVHICEGCRARAYGVSGDYLDEEPFCVYVPKGIERLTEVEDAHAGIVTELAGTTLNWNLEAKRLVSQIPEFVRGKVIKQIETAAKAKGLNEVTIEVVNEVRSSSMVQG
jgi:radical SAM protein with 4Fe4S-binding SPASM domain